MNSFHPENSQAVEGTQEQKFVVTFEIEQYCQHEKESLMNILTGITACSRPVEVNRAEKKYDIDISDWMAKGNIRAIQILLSEIPIVGCKITSTPVKVQTLLDRYADFQNVETMSDEDASSDDLVAAIENE